MLDIFRAIRRFFAAAASTFSRAREASGVTGGGRRGGELREEVTTQFDIRLRQRACNILCVCARVSSHVGYGSKAVSLRKEQFIQALAASRWGGKVAKNSTAHLSFEQICPCVCSICFSLSGSSPFSLGSNRFSRGLFSTLPLYLFSFSFFSGCSLPVPLLFVGLRVTLLLIGTQSLSKQLPRVPLEQFYLSMCRVGTESTINGC